MCSLVMGLRSTSEDLELKFECGFHDVAKTFVERIANRSPWPRMEVARLELWKGAAPYVIDMDNVYSVTIAECHDFVQYMKSLPEPEEEKNADDDTVESKESE